jgi:S-DNA-T family DNA segregation ATPase FtsK/SpoIIIE
MQNAIKILLPIGTDCGGTSVSADLKRLPHLLIAGAGAKEYLTALIANAAGELSPKDVRVISLHTDSRLNALPHLLSPVIEDEKAAEEALLWLKNECDRRFKLFAEAGTYDIDRYNEKAEDKLFYVIAVIGELERLTKKASGYTAMLAAKARAAGIYLIACTEKATKKAMTDLIRANVPSRIALKTETAAESRIILDAAGAEKLEAGALLYHPMGASAHERLGFTQQADSELEKSLAEIAKKYPGEAYITLSAREKTQAPLVSALEMALRYGAISTALLQRSLHIGYARAARLVDEMEAAGYIGAYRGYGAREVLISKTELEKLINELREN